MTEEKSSNLLHLPAQLQFTNVQLQRQLTLKNPTQKMVLFKIKSTDRDTLELQQFEGAINPLTSRTINIALKSLNPIREKKIKLLVQWIALPNDEYFRDRRLDSFSKEELSSKQIIIVERQVEAVTQPEFAPIGNTQSHSAPEIHKPVSEPIQDVPEPVKDSKDLQININLQRARNNQLTMISDRLTKEYRDAATKKEAIAAKHKGNRLFVTIIIISVFLTVYYGGRFIADL